MLIYVGLSDILSYTYVLTLCAINSRICYLNALYLTKATNNVLNKYRPEVQQLLVKMYRLPGDESSESNPFDSSIMVVG